MLAAALAASVLAGSGVAFAAAASAAAPHPRRAHAAHPPALARIEPRSLSPRAARAVNTCSVRPLRAIRPDTRPATHGHLSAVAPRVTRPLTVPLHRVRRLTVPLHRVRPLTVPLRRVRPLTVPLRRVRPLTVPLHRVRRLIVPLRRVRPLTAPVLRACQPLTRAVPVHSGREILLVGVRGAHVIRLGARRVAITHPDGRTIITIGRAHRG